MFVSGISLGQEKDARCSPMHGGGVELKRGVDVCFRNQFGARERCKGLSHAWWWGRVEEGRGCLFQESVWGKRKMQGAQPCMVVG